MTPREWCDWFCRRLALAIAKDTPGGIGRWDAAWTVVEEPSNALIEEIRRIESGEGDKECAKALGVDVLAAWRRAGMMWIAAEDAAA
jgi:hypothetical protein